MTVLLLVVGIVFLVFAGLALFSLNVSRKIEKALPALGQWVEVTGGRIHYVAGGPEDAPPVVMIHGILANLRHFSYALADRMAVDHRVILIDRPGWGYSTGTPRPGIGRQADMIAEALGKLGVVKPLVVGHSMGGAVSLALALRHPELPRGLALIAPFTQPVAQLVDTFRALQVPAFLAPIIAWTLSVPIGIRTGAQKTAQVFSPDPVPADFASRAGGVLALRPAGFESGAFEVRAANAEMERQAARYGEIALPVAILYGRGDYLLDPSLHGEKTAESIPGAKLTLIDGGHMPLIVRPDVTEAWLRDVLKGD
jgi:pimeloyl-ACP methyl ester carboxylesterase